MDARGSVVHCRGRGSAAACVDSSALPAVPGDFDPHALSAAGPAVLRSGSNCVSAAGHDCAAAGVYSAAAVLDNSIGALSDDRHACCGVLRVLTQPLEAV